VVKNRIREEAINLNFGTKIRFSIIFSNTMTATFTIAGINRPAKNLNKSLLKAT